MTVKLNVKATPDELSDICIRLQSLGVSAYSVAGTLEISSEPLRESAVAYAKNCLRAEGR